MLFACKLSNYKEYFFKGGSIIDFSVVIALIVVWVRLKPIRRVATPDTEKIISVRRGLSEKQYEARRAPTVLIKVSACMNRSVF